MILVIDHGRSWPPIATEHATAHPDAPAPGVELGEHYAECFGCGHQQPGGLHLRSVMGDGAHVHSEFKVTEAHQGAPGLAHGGLLACAFDEALGSAVGNLLRKPAVTASLETDFRRPVPVGSSLHIDAQLDGVSDRKIYANAVGHLDATDGPVAVSARALFVVVEFEHFTNHGDGAAWQKLRENAGQGDWDINP